MNVIPHTRLYRLLVLESAGSEIQVALTLGSC